MFREERRTSGFFLTRSRIYLVAVVLVVIWACFLAIRAARRAPTQGFEEPVENAGDSEHLKARASMVHGSGEGARIPQPSAPQPSAPQPSGRKTVLHLPQHAAARGSSADSQVVYYPGQDSLFPRQPTFLNSWSPPPGSKDQLELHREIDEKKMRTEEHLQASAFLPERFRGGWRPHYAGRDDPLVAARWKNDDEIPPDNDVVWKKANSSEKRVVTVVMWDGWTPFTWGQGANVNVPNYAGYPVTKGECPVDCRWSADKSRWAEADALVFDVCLTGPVEFRQIPVHMPERLPGQQWWWFAYEQQYYFPMMREADYMRRFDSKLLYHYDSSIQTTFTCPWGGHSTFLDAPPPKTKEKVVAAFLSNCNTGGALERTAYVRELSKYVKVESFGGCLKNSKIRKDQDKGMRRSHGDKINEKIGVISEYKFLLAFENNNGVDDYVTEKMTNAFQAGTVPVYWGSPTVDRWTIGNYSIIRTTDFASPKELGEYLTYLSENDDAYNRYFDWKKHGIGEQYQRLLDKCVFTAECRMCKAVALSVGSPEVHQDLQKLRAPQKLGYSLRLNCLDCREDRGVQYVEIANKPSLNLGSEFTLGAWIHLSVIQDGRIIDKNTAGKVDGYMFDVVKKDGPAGVIRLCASGSCWEGKRRLVTGIWYHVAVAYDGKDTTSGVRFYVNGHLDTSSPASGAVQTNSLPVRIGKAATGGWSWRPHHQTNTFDGIVDDVAIFSKTLSEQDIFELMFARLGGSENGLVAFLGFNEGSGQQVHDVSPNKNHGRIVGQPLWLKSVNKPLIEPSSMER